MAASNSLSTRLADSLPLNTTVRAYHLSTPPTKTDPIFSAAPGQPEETTFCESHFLGIATPRPDTDTVTDQEIFIFAIEVLVFTTPALTTVFVSKADSTGYSSLIKPPEGHPSITRSVVQTFIAFLLEPRLSEPRVVLSLFARSQDQYLFAGSIENAEKRVLDDRQLIKWWCRVLDGVWRPHDLDAVKQDISAHVVVPGTEKAETKAFFPPSSRSDAAGQPRWINDYPVKLLTVDASLPPRCLIPRLPDDPKARFLGDLDNDHTGGDGHWRSVKTLDQFWEFMSYRQECSAGRLVGFIWVTFVRPSLLEKETSTPSASFPSHDPHDPALPTPADSQHRLPENAVSMPVNGLEEIVIPQSPPPSSPPTQPLEAVPNEAYINDEVARPKEQSTKVSRPVDVRWPATTKGQTTCDLDTYEELTETLLRLDFAGQESAAQSTYQWTTIVKEKTSSQEFGLTISGRAIAKTVGTSDTTTESSTPQVTMLTGVRKKRKPEDGPSQQQTAPAVAVPTATTNVLAAGLVRKKPKTTSQG